MEFDVDVFNDLLQVAYQPLIFGFGLSTFLQLLSYGVFKAFSLLNTKNY